MSQIHYPDDMAALWGSIHHNEDHATMAAVRIYVQEDTSHLFPLDELRLAHQLLLAAAADVLDQMADLIPSPSREGVSQPLQSNVAGYPSATPHRGAETPLKAPAGAGMTSSRSRAGSQSEEAQAACLPNRDDTTVVMSTGGKVHHF